MLEWAVVHGQHRYGTLRGPIALRTRERFEHHSRDRYSRRAPGKTARCPGNFCVFLPRRGMSLFVDYKREGPESPEEQARRLETAKIEFDAQSEFDVDGCQRRCRFGS